MVLFIHCLNTVFEAEFYWDVAPRWLALRSKWSEWVLCIFSRKSGYLNLFLFNYLNLENIRKMHIKCCLWSERWFSKCSILFTFCASAALGMWLSRNLSLVTGTAGLNLERCVCCHKAVWPPWFLDPGFLGSFGNATPDPSPCSELALAAQSLVRGTICLAYWMCEGV